MLRPSGVAVVAVVAASVVVCAAMASSLRTITDPKGDTPAADLDLRSVFVSAGARVRVTITTAAPIRGNAIYSADLSCGAKAWQLAAKRAAGATTFFVFDWQTSRQRPALGDIAGRRIILTAPSGAIRCQRGLRFVVTAEGTNGRPRMTDRAPNRGQAKV